ncbi:hypothetical protein BT93_H3035 [Corymbia citriodora subsp. variegata]|nr:hypothetical protein BT93_H3035 [Corymbia citriodora subsp. variegata]
MRRLDDVITGNIPHLSWTSTSASPRVQSRAHLLPFTLSSRHFLCTFSSASLQSLSPSSISAGALPHSLQHRR